MKNTHNMMTLLAVAAIASGWLLTGCGHKVQRAPTLTKTPEAPARPPEKGLLTKAADTTWNVVSAPVRWVAPAKKPVGPPEEPERYEPADVIIMAPGGGPWEPAVPAAPKAAEPATAQTK